MIRKKDENMDLMKAIKTRRSIRKYSTEQVSNIDLEDIVELASYSPSWKNSQTVGYVIIRDHDLLNRIAEEGVMGFTHNTGIIKNCQALVVLTTIKGHCGYEKDGSFSTKKKDGWEMFDAGIAAQTFQLAAHECGIGSVVMGIFDEVKVKELLGLDDTLNVSALIAIGHPAIQPTAPARKPVQELIQYR